MNKNKIIIILLMILSLSFYSVNAEELVDGVLEDSYQEELNTEQVENNMNEQSLDTSSYTYQNPDTDYTATVSDDANLLSDAEKRKLLEAMKPLTEYGYIEFVSTDTADGYYDTSSYAADYYHSHYSTDSGSIFVIDMKNREIFIFSDGDNYRIITNSKAYSITDNVYREASNENYYKCASIAFDEMLTLLRGYKIMEPMRYTSIVFISLTLSFFLTFLFVLSKSKIRSASNKSILKNCDIQYKVGKVKPVKKGQHSVYSPPSDSSSGGGSSGGGGGGGGGGGSSGGGGGHSF